MLNNYERIITAATATKTTAAIDLDNRVNVSIMVSAEAIVTGTGTLSVDASNDGVNWDKNIAFIDSKSTTPATRVTTLACDASQNPAVPQMLYLGADFGAKFIRVTLTVATGGTYDVDIFAMKRIIGN